MSLSMSTSVVIPCYNGARFLDGLLNSIQMQMLDRISVVIVDNASTDETVLVAKQSPLNVEVIQLNENKGFGIASNYGIREAIGKGAEVVVLLNQDLIVERNAIDEALDVLGREQDIGILGFYQLDWEGGQIDQLLFRHLPADYWNDLALRVPKPCYRVPFCPAAAVAIRTECILDVGAFSPLFFMYFEDRELCDRVRNAGWGVALSTRARVRHYCGQQRARRDFRWKLNWHYSRTLHMLITCKRPFPLSVLYAFKPIVPKWSLSEMFWRVIGFGRCAWVFPEIIRHRRRYRRAGCSHRIRGRSED